MDAILEVILNALLTNPISLKLIGFWLLFTFVFWFLFANLMWIKRGVESGQWTGWRKWVAYAVGYTILIPGYLYDVLYNYTWGSLMFWQFPRKGEPTFTARLKRTVFDNGWRGTVARFVCRYLVEPNDEKHCGEYKHG